MVKMSTSCPNLINSLFQTVQKVISGSITTNLTRKSIQPIIEICDRLLPSHLRLSIPTISNSIKKDTSNDKTVKYQHIWEDSGVTIGVFVLPPGAIIPLHNHPNMTVISRLLYGTLKLKAFDLIVDDNNKHKKNLIENNKSNNKIHLATRRKDSTILAPHTTLLLPDFCNLHEFVADNDIGCAVLDILTPPYNPDQGRDCTYYEVQEKINSDTNETDDKNIYILREYEEPPAGFCVVFSKYEGPPIVPISETK